MPMTPSKSDMADRIEDCLDSAFKAIDDQRLATAVRDIDRAQVVLGLLRDACDLGPTRMERLAIKLREAKDSRDA